MDLPAVAIICPLYGRPERTADFVDACMSAATGPQEIVLVVSSDRHEDRVAADATIASVLTINGPRRHGDWARKVNAAYAATDHPLMLLCGDDVRPRRGWHDEVANAYAQGYGVIGTQDLGNRHVIAGLHSTHPVVARWYADRHGTVDAPGIVAPEVYDHNWVDNEIVVTAKARGLWTFCNNAVIEHLHPSWGKGVYDDTYTLGSEAFDRDRWTYHMREHLWTSLSPLPRTAVTDGAT